MNIEMAIDNIQKDLIENVDNMQNNGGFVLAKFYRLMLAPLHLLLSQARNLNTPLTQLNLKEYIQEFAIFCFSIIFGCYF